MKKIKSNPTDVRLTIFDAAYANENAYIQVLNYVTTKDLWGGYGFYFYDLSHIVHSFEQCEANSLQKGSRKIWHFTITFKDRWSIASLYIMANIIASLFAHKYQIIFSVDSKGRTPHLHFAVNNYSFDPSYPTLTDAQMKEYGCIILAYLKRTVPNTKHTKLSFKEVPYNV